MTLYGLGENGKDKVENLKYTVSNGKASVTYGETKIETSVIKDDTFTASLDGKEENACAFSTTPGKKYQTPNPDPTPKPDPEPTPDPDPTPNPDPDPNPTPEPDPDPTPDPEPNPTPNPDPNPNPDPTPTNPFAGKTFYGSYTFDDEDIKGTFDVAEIRFKDSELTFVVYGGKKDGSDDYKETSPYTVADGKATMTLYEEDTIITSVITNDKFTITFGEGEEIFTYSFSTTQGTKITEVFDIPTEEKTILDNAGIAGGMNSWNGSPLTKVNSTIYTYEFTATEDNVKFKVQKIKDSWNDGEWGGVTILAKDASNENIPSEKVSLNYYSKDGSNAEITNLSINSKYLLTIIIDDEASNVISATVTLKEYIAPPPKPTAYSLEGLTFKGAWVADWSDQKTLKAGETQEIEITATNEGNQFGIFGSGGNLWEGTNIPFGKDAELTYKKDGGSNSTMASGFKIGKTYIVVLKITDNSLTDPKLTIKVTEK